MFISISYVCVVYKTIKWPYQPKHSPSSSPEHELPEQLFACRAESDGNTNYDTHYMGIGNN